MKQYKIIAACKAMDKILESNVSFGVKNTVFKLRKRFQQEWDFQLEREEVLKSKLEIQTVDGKERYTEKSIEEYYKKIEELGNTEVEISIDPIEIKITEDIEKELSVLKRDDLFYLDGFIEFE